jgi:hypothetical protein
MEGTAVDHCLRAAKCALRVSSFQYDAETFVNNSVHHDLSQMLRGIFMKVKVGKRVLGFILKIQKGMGFGTLYGLNVGGIIRGEYGPRWEFLVVGDPLSQVFIATFTYIYVPRCATQNMKLRYPP